MLFKALLRVQSAHPERVTIVLNQSCLSAGHARFLEGALAQHYHTTRWPVLHVSTAGAWEASISDFWMLWLDEWTHALATPAARTTLGEIYKRAEQRYWEQNRAVQAHNESVADAAPAFKPLSFGTVHLHEGRGKDGRPMRETVLWDLLID
jgi:hypothetical protein